MPLVASAPIYVVKPMPAQIADADRRALLDLDVATIGHSLDAGFMDPVIRSNQPGGKIAGTAVTVRLTLPDSVMGHYALKFVRPGDILVIDRGQDQLTACWGWEFVPTPRGEERWSRGVAACLVEAAF